MVGQFEKFVSAAHQIESAVTFGSATTIAAQDRADKCEEHGASAAASAVMAPAFLSVMLVVLR